MKKRFTTILLMVSLVVICGLFMPGAERVIERSTILVQSIKDMFDSAKGATDSTKGLLDAIGDVFDGKATVIVHEKVVFRPAKEVTELVTAQQTFEHRIDWSNSHSGDKIDRKS